MDEKKYKLICVRKGKTNYARTNNRKNVTLGSYIYVVKKATCQSLRQCQKYMIVE